MSQDKPKLPQRSLGQPTGQAKAESGKTPSPKVDVPIPPPPVPPVPVLPVAPAAAPGSNGEDDGFEVTLDDDEPDVANLADPWGDGKEEIASRGIALETVSPETATVAPPPAPPPAPSGQKNSFEMLMEGAAELFSLGDFSGSLETIEKALEIKPSDPGALEFMQRNQQTLMKMFESKLGGLQKRPRVKVDPSEIMWLSLDHRAGFVLAQIDGFVSYDEVMTLSGMNKFDTLRILAKLCEEGVIESV